MPIILTVGVFVFLIVDMDKMNLVKIGWRLINELSFQDIPKFD